MVPSERGKDMSYANDMQAREARAQELLGTYTIKTSADLLISHLRKQIGGWLYANNNALIFLANAPISPVLGRRPELVDDYTLKLDLPGRPHKLTAPMLVPAGIINFGDGIEFAGQKKHIKAIAAVAAR